MKTNNSDIQKVLVLGGSGDQGWPLINALNEYGVEVIAGVRRLDAMDNTPHANIATLAADISDQASLEAAFGQVDALAMNLPFEHDIEIATSYGKNIANAARAAGLKKLVFNTSCFIADGEDLGLGGHEGRQRIEKEIEDCGVDYVVIRPTVFMDNAIRQWIKPSIVNNSTFPYAAKDTLKISWIALEDVGRLMACALFSSEVSREKILVGGPEALTGHDVARCLTAVAGREISFQSLEPIELAENLSEMVTGSREVPEGSVYWGMARFYSWYNEQPISPLAVDPLSFQSKLPVQLTTYAQWAAKQDWDKV